MVIAALTALLRWPDRGQALAYARGFQLVGPIAPSHIFRPLGFDPDAPGIEGQEGFYGQEAEAAAENLLRSPPPKGHLLIHAETLEEQRKGWLSQFWRKLAWTRSLA